MADNTEIPLKLKIDGVDTLIDSLKAAKQARKDLSSAFLAGDQDAAKSLGLLSEKLEDLHKSTNSLQGSGVEKLNNSFGVLKEGISGLDFGKISIGFKGIGAAMSAVPLLLFTEGIQLLVENFDKILALFNSTEKETRRLTQAFNDQKASSDALNTSINAKISVMEAELDLLKAQTGTTQQVIDLEKQINEQKIEAIQNDIKTLTAGVALEKQKLSAIINENSFFESLVKTEAQIYRNIGATETANQLDAQATNNKLERANESYNTLKKAQADLSKLNADLRIIDIKADKDALDAHKKATQDYKTELDKRKNAASEHNKSVNSDFAASLADEQAQLAADAKQTSDTQAQRDANTLAGNKLLIQQQADLDAQAAQQAQQNAERDKALQLKNAQEVAQAKNFIEKEGFAGAQALSDAYFSTQLNSAKGNQAALTEIAKKQFNVNKALQIAQAVIDGFRAVTTNIAAFPAPYGEIAGVIAGIAAAANIAKIAATQFNPQSSSVSGGSTASLPSSPPPPQLSNPNAVQTTNLPRPQDRSMPIAQVVETQLTSTVNRVARIKNQASF